MGAPFSATLSFLFDLLAPPRATDIVVRSLTLAQLRTLMRSGEALLPYEDAHVRALVWELKYHGNPRAAALAGALLAEALIAIASEELGKPLLIPIPMHKARRRERGHNQCELICEAARQQAETFVEYAPQALMRVRQTPLQQGLPRTQRLRNVERTMEASGTVRNRVCVVVDDVLTTGATLSEARRALTHAGAKSVVCVALAHS